MDGGIVYMWLDYMEVQISPFMILAFPSKYSQLARARYGCLLPLWKNIAIILNQWLPIEVVCVALILYTFIDH